jgi:hypothetical protein
MAHCPSCNTSSVRQRQNVVNGVHFTMVVHDFTCLECGAFENDEADGPGLPTMYSRWGAMNAFARTIAVAAAPSLLAAVTPKPRTNVVALAAAAGRVANADTDATRRAALATMRELATLLLALDREVPLAA